MRIAPVTRGQFPAWKRMRRTLYSGLDVAFHDAEMEWIFCSQEAACFIAWSESGEPVGLLELSLRNIVDGCVGGPVGYIEGIYLEPASRGRGHGSKLVAFAADWFQSRGCRNMATDAEITNVEAQAFYRKTGFREGWRVVGYTRKLDEPDTT